MRRQGRTWRPSLRVPLKAHRPDDRGVPMPWCGCDTCHKARTDQANAAEDRHWAHVGVLLDLNTKDDDEKP